MSVETAGSVIERAGSERHRAIEQQGVHERLGQIPAQLTLLDVELLGQQPERPARGAVAVKYVGGRRVPAAGVDSSRAGS
jgi:hypothetical protein